MKRILVIITTAFTATGGLASVMLNYYRSLDKKGLQIDFASTNTITPDLNDEIKKTVANIISFPKEKISLDIGRQLSVCREIMMLFIYMPIVLLP